MLFRCPECGEKISSKAKMCVHCGCPVEYTNQNQIFINGVEYDFTDIISEAKEDVLVYYIARLIMDETHLDWASSNVLAEIIKKKENLPHEFNGPIEKPLGGPMAHAPICPTCQSANVEKISSMSRMGSVATLGLFSNKLNKTYKCKNCGYMW